MDAAGAGVADLTTSKTAADLDPAWSPDGQHLAFARTVREGGKPDLYVVNASGGSRERLTRTSVAERDPAWSPAARAWRSRRGQAWAGRSASSSCAPTDRAHAVTTQGDGDVDAAPVWSPDGTQIAFTSDRDGGLPSCT